MQANDNEEIVTLGQLTEVERRLQEWESKTFLAGVDYEDFWGQIKLVGYTMQLRAKHMQMIAPNIGIDYERDFKTDKITVAKCLLMDEAFGFHDGLHEPTKLLLLGFLYCKYRSLESH